MRLDAFIFLLAQEQTGTGGLRGWIDSAAKTPISKVVIAVAILTAIRFAISPIVAKTPAEKRLGFYTLIRVLNEVLDAVIYAGVLVFMVIRPFAVQAFSIPSGSMWPSLYVNDFIVANKAIYRYSDPKINDIVVFRPPKAATLQNPLQLDPDGTVNLDFVKRCVGAPGDVVEVREGYLYRNGVKVNDSHRHYSATTDEANFSELPVDDVLRMPMASFKFIKWNGRIIPLNYTKTSANASTGEYIDHQTIYSVAPEFVIPDPNDQVKAMKLPAEAVPKGFYFMMGDNRNDSFDGRGWGLVPRDSIIGKSEMIWLPLSRVQITR